MHLAIHQFQKLMSKTNVAIISDNVFLARTIHSLSIAQGWADAFPLTFFCSRSSPLLSNSELPFEVSPITLKTDHSAISGHFEIIISAHCKQLFPGELVRSARCANIHPGLNPHNRGWYPQVFSILNKKPWGATFHVIDEELDHGPIIAQTELPLYSWDTSLTAYERVQHAEATLLETHLEAFLKGHQSTSAPKEEGNINLKADFAKLCQLNLAESGTLGEHIDLLRALTHGTYKNGYFLDPATGRRVYVQLLLTTDP